jgi:hypothetical protein
MFVHFSGNVSFVVYLKLCTKDQYNLKGQSLGVFYSRVSHLLWDFKTVVILVDDIVSFISDMYVSFQDMQRTRVS